jgi:mRNA interferase RelE/StbE
MAYRIEYTPAFERSFRRLPRDVQVRVSRKISALASEPRPPGSRKLHGTADLWRIRVGPYRVLYQIQDAVLLVVLIEVAHRREVYRNL